MDKQAKQPDPSKRLGAWMVVLAWIVLIALVAIFFSRWTEKQYNPNQSLSQTVTSIGVREVVLQRNRYGQYVATGAINGRPVTFMVDTGASDISVPQKLATALGLKRGAPVNYQTANGIVTNYTTVLESVSMGSIKLVNVRASINPYVTTDDVLLGMSFLKYLEFTQKGTQLTIRQYP